MSSHGADPRRHHLALLLRPEWRCQLLSTPPSSQSDHSPPPIHTAQTPLPRLSTIHLSSHHLGPRIWHPTPRMDIPRHRDTPPPPMRPTTTPTSKLCMLMLSLRSPCLITVDLIPDRCMMIFTRHMDRHMDIDHLHPLLRMVMDMDIMVNCRVSVWAEDQAVGKQVPADILCRLYDLP
jgi:hypothetical protein